MPPGMIMYSSDYIHVDEFCSFLSYHGADLSPPGFGNASISYDENVLWVYYSVIGLSDWYMCYMDQYDLFATITAYLACPPQSQIIIDRNRTQHSRYYAFKFVQLFMNHWPCILIDDEDHIYTHQDVNSFLLQF